MSGMGARLHMLRIQKKWSQKRLEEESGVSQGAISLYENDSRPGVPLAHVMRLADALDVPLQLLAYGERYEDSAKNRRKR